MQCHYKKKISGFKDWEQLNHSEEYLIYPQNIGENLGIDELSLSKGELYTFVTNKNGRGKKKTLVAVVKGTKSQDIIDVLNKISLEKRKSVKEITLDMANNMQLASRMCFPESSLVTDRFHVVKLVMEALQHQRIKLRWEAIEKKNQAIKAAKEQGIKYIQITFIKASKAPSHNLAEIVTFLPANSTLLRTKSDVGSNVVGNIPITPILLLICTASSAIAWSTRITGTLLKVAAVSIATPIEEQVTKITSAPASSAA